MGAEFGSRRSEVSSEQAPEESVVNKREAPPQIGARHRLSDGLLDLGSESMVEGLGIREAVLFGNNSPVPPTTQVNNSDIPSTDGNAKPLSHSLLDPD